MVRKAAKVRTATSPVGNNRGFTILELLIVLAIMAVAYAMAAPKIGAGLQTLEARAAARALVSTLREARVQAISRRIDVAVVLDMDQRDYTVGGDTKRHILPIGTELILDTAQSELLTSRSGAIRFFPDGSSTGGRITLALGTERQQISIDWLTGRAQIAH